MDDSRTLPEDTVPAHADGGAPSSIPAYQLGELLGRGGMGEVVLAKDPRFGREVALKRMRGAVTPEATARFLREAKIQARLDHPAIVPIHELGTDDAGLPYFTMKRLAGTTLADVLARRSATQQSLLRALVDVCLAIELAHERHIIHRDLKPANIMLGNYGEVYVLDWGVARMLDEDEPPRVAGAPIDGTNTGDILGTPGYMSPEQVRGEPVTSATDVYALGAILFELLAGEPLHPRGLAALASTTGDPVVSPAVRRPDGVAPELDAVCCAALASSAAARPSARELGERIQRYLDGDRDVERRRMLAAEAFAEAQRAVASGDPSQRAEAVRAASRALALDPTSSDAAHLFAKLVAEPPPELPAVLTRKLHDEELQNTRERSRRALRPMFAFLLIVPALASLEVQSWAAIALITSVVAMTFVLSFINWRVRDLPAAFQLGINFMLALALSRIVGPFILTPMVIIGSLLAFAVHPGLERKKWVLVAWIAVTSLAPFVLEWTGVLAPSWRQTDAGLVSFGSVFVPNGGPTGVLLLVGANLAVTLVIGLYQIRLSHDQRDLQRRLHIQAWHLDQLIPRPGGDHAARAVAAAGTRSRAVPA